MILLCGMQLGASLVYFTFAIAVFIACAQFLKFGSTRNDFVEVVRGQRWVWYILAGYLLIASCVMLFNRVDSLRSWGELKWVLFFLVFVILSVAFFEGPPAERIRRVRAWAYVILGVVCFSGIAAIYQFLTQTDPFRDFFGQSPSVNPARGHGMLRNPVPFGKLMGGLGLIFLAFCLTTSPRRRAVSVLSGLGVLACFASVIASQSRGAWLSLICMVVLAAVFVPGDLRKKSAGALLVILSLSFLVIFLNPSLSGRAQTIGNDTPQGSNRVRLEQWHANWVILTRNPLGVGFDGNDKREEAIYAELGYELPQMRGHCHNEFLEIAVATGWLGLACYLAFSFLLLWIPLVAIRKVEGNCFLRFLLLASVFVQAFLHLAVFTDQMDSQSRMMMCAAWGIGLAVGVLADSKRDSGGIVSEEHDSELCQA